MIVTVHDLNEFEDRVEFSKDVFFTWETRNEGRHLPKIAVDQKLYGVGRDGVSLVVYNRVTMVTVDNAGDAPNLYDGIQIAVRKEIKDFEAEAARFAAAHGCKAVAGDLKPSPLNAHLSSMLAQRLEAIEERVAKVERCAACQCAEIRTLEKTISPIITGS
ncbi:hypothetical protein FGU65_09225 [Methanoculleus sp. FWC-SCC1]|uniref:Uncharacterized protein n=1 Tax=Methanoculleus frigidifontis TaxID=2584085 RepID=A0ABT8MAV0_9EURY|nr:hypothetical protein [Methanoculleus sp. FWC-SCC1]MDN7025065.1 hypothetical protein [Methanoculleus sp. FWC-SCC1]